MVPNSAKSLTITNLFSESHKNIQDTLPLVGLLFGLHPNIILPKFVHAEEHLLGILLNWSDSYLYNLDDEV